MKNKTQGSDYSNPAETKGSDYYTLLRQMKRQNTFSESELTELKTQFEKARHKYQPGLLKYLLIAEAPPDSIEWFFYYEDVREHDDLFLGIAQALYPDLKDKYLASGRNQDIKNSILLMFKAEGFYLIDLSDIPLSLMKGDLSLQLPSLPDKIKNASDENTKIILIKASVYDAAFRFLKLEEFENVVDIRIPFPGGGGGTKNISNSVQQST